MAERRGGRSGQTRVVSVEPPGAEGRGAVSDTRLDELLSLALDVPGGDRELATRIEAAIVAQGIPRPPTGPRLWLWLIPPALGGLSVSALWLLGLAGVPLQSLATALWGCYAALNSLPGVLGSAGVLAAVALVGAVDLAMLGFRPDRMGVRT